MKEIVDKLLAVEAELSEERDEFNLFALFLREDAGNKWDLLVSADWVSENKADSIKLIAQRVQEKLETNELLNLSRIVVIDVENPALESFHRAVSEEHGSVEINSGIFFGLHIKRAIVISSRKNTAEAS